jgi:Flp pilus assembly protein TadG
MSIHRDTAHSDIDHRPRRGHGPRKGGIGGFVRDEGGAALIFILVLISLMLVSTGSAIDFLRHERERARLQDALDRAVLAAASLKQEDNPVDVVEKYLNASGVDYSFPKDGGEWPKVEEKVFGVGEDQVVHSRRVTVCAESEINTTFMQLITMWMPGGKDDDSYRTLGLETCAVAREEIRPIEISMVLDISGSMRFTGRDANGGSTGKSRIESLRPAASTFIDIVMTDKELTTINLVPYAGQVNIAPIFDSFNVYEDLDELDEDEVADGRDHTFSSCIEIDETSEFDIVTSNELIQPVMPSTSAERRQVPHFMNWPIASSWMDWGWCPQDDASVEILEDDPDKLKTKVNEMRLHDGTGTHYGMLWALAFLDPASAPYISHLAGEEFQDRPGPWMDPDKDGPQTDKIIVLMTDGKIVEQIRPDDPYDEWHHTNECKDNNSKCGDRRSRSQNFDSFEDICDVARARRVRVFTISVDMNDSNTNGYLQRCASHPSFFFQTNSDDLEGVFTNIAETINRLQLSPYDRPGS